MKKKKAGNKAKAFEEEKFSLDDALREAARCLQCFDAPCTQRCPASIPVPRFIRMTRSGNFCGAAEVVRAAHPLAHSCGEACPAENMCQSVCTRGSVDFPVKIRDLHRFATARAAKAGERAPRASKRIGGKVAVIGGGPAGLSCARELSWAGVDVDLFEKQGVVGGILVEQIPSFRLAPGAVRRDVSGALGDSVVVKRRREVTDVAALADGYDAVFVGAGAYGEASLGLPGENLEGVMTSRDFLRELKKGKLRKPGNVVIIGGGNVALDCGVAALRAGAKSAAIYYRRSFNQMPAWERELDMALGAGVELVMLSIPKAFVGAKGKLRGVRFLRAKLGRPGRDGRRLPVAVAKSEFHVPCDTAVLAAGQRVGRDLLKQLTGGTDGPGFNERTMNAWGRIFIGGDLAGRGTIVEAAGDGKRAAAAILNVIAKRKTARGKQ
ncbi:MAG: FAD-dependent oxidoreductase [Pseudomonadota bacterium]